MNRHAEAPAEEKPLTTIDDISKPNCPPQALRHRERALHVDPAGHKNKFLPAKPRSDVFFPCGLAKNGAHRAKRLIAAEVPVAIVERFEMVEVREQKRKGLAMMTRSGELDLDPLVEKCAIVEAREPIPDGALIKSPSRELFAFISEAHPNDSLAAKLDAIAIAQCPRLQQGKPVQERPIGTPEIAYIELAARSADLGVDGGDARIVEAELALSRSTQKKGRGADGEDGA